MSQNPRDMTPWEFATWAERWTNDVFKLAHRKGVRHGKILSDAELTRRAMHRTLHRTRIVPPLA